MTVPDSLFFIVHVQCCHFLATGALVWCDSIIPLSSGVEASTFQSSPHPSGHDRSDTQPSRVAAFEVAWLELSVSLSNSIKT